jgi:uncharacterized protein
MTESSRPPVFFFDNRDPEMQRAYENARATFRYFWRELSWEYRRIIPALDLACVKAPFWDGDKTRAPSDESEVEQMWFSEIEFDGDYVSGVLINSPNWLKSIAQGDAVRIPLGQISDWMYAISGEVFGAYTVNLIRSRMSRQERKDHDDAWGQNFGDPAKIRLAPEPKKGGGLLKSWFGKKQEDSGEHPMCENMVESFQEQLKKDPTFATSKDGRGWTLLHRESLAGNAPIVKALLEARADPKAKTPEGRTPLELARRMGWENVTAVLTGR